MNRERLDTHEMMPSGMREYLSTYGWNFSKKLCDFAVSRMEVKDSSGNKTKLTPWSKDEVDEMMKKNGVELKNNVGYNATYLANMLKADFFKKSLPDEQHLCVHIKCYLDDIDGSPTRAMDEYYASCIAKGIPVIWEDML